RVERQRDPPLEPLPRPRNAQVVQGLLQELGHLLLAETREHEALVPGEELDEPPLVGAQLEEVVRLHELRHLAVDLRPRAVGIAVLVEEELLLPGAVEAPVLPL